MSAPTPVRRSGRRDASPLITRSAGDPPEAGTDDAAGAAPDDAGEDLPLVEFDAEPGDADPAPGSSPRRNVLQRLDDAAIPHLQRGAWRIATVLLAPFTALRRAEERIAGGRVIGVLWSWRQGMALLTGLILCVGAYTHLQWFDPAETALEEPAQAEVAPEAGELPGETTAEALTVGPTIGQPIAAYAEERAAVLEEAAAAGEHLAVVSFTDLRSAAEVEEFAESFEALAVQIQIPGGEQEPYTVRVEEGIAAAVEASLDQQREQVAADEAEIRRLLESGTVTDEEFATDYNEQAERLAAVRQQLEEGVGTVFAVVVRGSAETLREAHQREEVRLVDLAPADADEASTTFYGLLPSDTETATWGAFG